MYRIGELARRTGTSVDLLRAWERRYGLLRPERTEGGFRLYGEEDAARVERMRTGIAGGLAAAEAAHAALPPPRRRTAGGAPAARAQRRAAAGAPRMQRRTGERHPRQPVLQADGLRRAPRVDPA